jgi:hypothetical protein
MHGNTPGIDGGHTGRGHYNSAFGTMPADIFKESGFARTGLAGKKDGAGCIVYKTGRQVKAGIGRVRLMHDWYI